jgi:hypothetical protein
VLGYIDRRGNKQRDLWNIDHATNLLLQDAGFVLPKAALADRHFYGMTADFRPREDAFYMSTLLILRAQLRGRLATRHRSSDDEFVKNYRETSR